MYSNLKLGSRAGRNGGGVLKCEMSPRGGLPLSPNHPAVHEISENMGWKREGASRRELILMAFLPLPYLSPSAKLLPYIDLVNVAVDIVIHVLQYRLHFWRTSGFICEGQAQKHHEKDTSRNAVVISVQLDPNSFPALLS